ncbi:hypothetical protein MSG28_002593 [Choristoneura fumiferana]|uniref:Uncharacterized protein n=1 Tax=Choristoneura fumiferana TaxID=7141 RepID=A0ACC0JIF4_CHOFU|nr:hypothetical protein MSG28_002593 [Choristoneura fumiferana]
MREVWPASAHVCHTCCKKHSSFRPLYSSEHRAAMGPPAPSSDRKPNQKCNSSRARRDRYYTRGGGGGGARGAGGAGRGERRAGSLRRAPRRRSHVSPRARAMVARTDESMFGCYGDSYSYRLWSLANVWGACRCEEPHWDLSPLTSAEAVKSPCSTS